LYNVTLKYNDKQVTNTIITISFVLDDYHH